MFNSRVLLLTLVGVNLLGGGLLLVRSANLTPEKTTFSTYQTSSNSIKVDISGAVNSPGTYTLLDTNRVEDALASAGGILETADRDWLSKYINMTQLLTDGQKIYIPAISDNKNDIKRISINAGTRDELIALRGIGEIIADKIIAARPFADINELWEKKILSQKVFEGIKSQISLW